VVANHPHGLLDGLVLGSLLSRRRKDFRLLANSILAELDGMSRFVISVDVLDGNPYLNSSAARAAMRWLRAGGAVVAFPAGEVSALNGIPPRIDDRTWSGGPLRLAQRTDARVIHAFVSGHNSVGFQMAGVAHPAFRTLLLGRELLNKSGRTVRVTVGRPIPRCDSEHLGSEDLRRRT
jgi:putative hemolysin